MLITPAPILPRLQRLNDGVAGFVVVFGGVFVGGAVAAADVAAGEAEAQIDPGFAAVQALLAALGLGRDGLNPAVVWAAGLFPAGIAIEQAL